MIIYISMYKFKPTKLGSNPVKMNKSLPSLGLGSLKTDGKPKFIMLSLAAMFGFVVIIFLYYLFRKPVKSTKQVNNIELQDNNNKIINSNLDEQTNNKHSNGNSLVKSVPSLESDLLSNDKPLKNQVFNIKQNIYPYKDAEAVCNAFGSDVATVEQLVEAHKKGANWCNVGWTKDGLAAYPIQNKYWLKMQENESSKKNMCGVPGINLVRNNPNLLYGVNCYGPKPMPRGNEKVKHVYVSDKDRKLAARTQEIRKNLNAVNVMPFNEDDWSSCGMKL